MAVTDRGFPATFEHPSAGRSELDARRLAVRWTSGAAAEAKQALIEEAGLIPATVGDDDRRPLLSVNRTEGLWWVQRADGSTVDEDVLDRLEQSDLVEWVSPAYRSGQAPGGRLGGGPEAVDRADDAALYAVNPKRVYVRQQALDRLRGAEALGEVGPEPGRTTRLPGYTVMEVRTGTALTFTGAVTEALTARGAPPTGAVRFETIPFVSPTTCGGTKRSRGPRTCQPPTGELTPNDPTFGLQWNLQRTEVPRAWQITRGDPSVVVAVIDEGVELTHPDLDLHPQSWNASTDLPDGGPTGNHGTACAGIVAARLDNALGVAGVAGGSRIMAIATATWADVDIAEGLYFAADNGARVVSMSFGVYPEWGFWDFDLIRDALQYAHDKGLLLVAASGNEDGAVARFPGSDARTLCVGGSNRSDERKRTNDASAEPWWGASYGPDLDVVAPCLEIPTTDRLGGDGYDAGDYFDRFNGTSSATPLVAGLGALLFSLRPDLDNVAARHIIETTCDKISPALYAYQNVASKPSGTWNDEVGYGRVNAERALLAACAEPGGGEDDGCCGCGGECEEETPRECRGPKPPPWLAHDRCQYFYESRVFGVPRPNRLQIRVTYEHCLAFLGRQQGPLLYTTTLLPGEEVNLYEFDRYRRVRSAEQRLSVHSTFRQTLSALSQTRRFGSSSAYVRTLTDIRTSTDTSVSTGGGLAGFFGAPQTNSEFGVDTETSIASGASIAQVSEQFAQNAVTASQATEAERSIVISSFEDAEHREATRRTVRNHNHCHAVTYFVRRVMEVYRAHSRVVAIEWRIGDAPWRTIDDLSDDVRDAFDELRDVLPRRDDEAGDRRQITIPTDGTLYEAELAYCSSCEPLREAQLRIEVEEARLRARRACLKTERLARDLEHRK